MTVVDNVLTFAYCEKHTRLRFRQADCVASWDNPEPWNKNYGTQSVITFEKIKYM